MKHPLNILFKEFETNEDKSNHDKKLSVIIGSDDWKVITKELNELIGKAYMRYDSASSAEEFYTIKGYVDGLKTLTGMDKLHSMRRVLGARVVKAPSKTQRFAT